VPTVAGCRSWGWSLRRRSRTRRGAAAIAERLLGTLASPTGRSAKARGPATRPCTAGWGGRR
jgi:hypothetical protein